MKWGGGGGGGRGRSIYNIWRKLQRSKNNLPVLIMNGVIVLSVPGSSLKFKK